MTDENKEPLDDENIEEVSASEGHPSYEELNVDPLDIEEIECVYGAPVTGNEEQYLTDPDILVTDEEPIDLTAPEYGAPPVIGFVPFPDPEDTSAFLPTPNPENPLNSLGWQLGEQGPVDFQTSSFITNDETEPWSSAPDPNDDIDSLV